MAEFKRFDPERWEPQPEPKGTAKVANSAKAETSFATLAGLAALAGTTSAGLTALDENRCPHGVKASAWATAVRDAKRLADDGWAAKALALGWTALDLFGAVTDRDGDPEADGLAVKLAGRKVLAISENFATVQDGENGRAYLHRRGSEGGRLLWELGCGNAKIGRIPY